MPSAKHVAWISKGIDNIQQAGPYNETSVHKSLLTKRLIELDDRLGEGNVTWWCTYVLEVDDKQKIKMNVLEEHSRPPVETLELNLAAKTIKKKTTVKKINNELQF